MQVMLGRRNWKQKNLEAKGTIGPIKFQRKRVTYANTKMKTVIATQSILISWDMPLLQGRMLPGLL